MRLSPQTVGALAPDVARPGYDRDAQAVGIVHFGIGAFHRAHQATYVDTAMAAGDRDWAIAGVSLRAPAVRDQLAPQSGLFTVTERSGAGESARLIGAVRDVLVAPEDPAAVIAALAAPATGIASFTVTEKGYHRALGGGLDRTAAPVAADLAGDGPPRTLYGFLDAGLARRREQGLPGLTLLCCDNLPGNGALLAALVGEFLQDRDPALRAWLEAECACPSTMVDRIVPAITADDLARVETQIGLRDEGAVVTEPFTQWVIEDRFAGPRPRLELAGAQLVADVRPWETAKLRMLNGAHSALAYLGLACGHAFVHEAVADPAIRLLVERLMRDEAAATLSPAQGLDPDAYADALLARFSNAALGHRLRQIAMDGSQKIPQRWLETLAHHQHRGHQCPAILTALAAWIRHVRGDGHVVDDPLAERLAGLWAQAGQEGIVDALFGTGGLFAPHWTAAAVDRDFLAARIAS